MALKNTTYADWLKTDRVLSIRGKVGDDRINGFAYEFGPSDVVRYTVNSSLGTSGVSVGNVTASTYTLELSKEWQYCDAYLELSRRRDFSGNIAKFAVRVEIGVDVNGTMKYENFGYWLIESVSGDDSLETAITISGTDALDSLSEIKVRDDGTYDRSSTKVDTVLKRIGGSFRYATGVNVPTYSNVTIWPLQYKTWANDPDIPRNRLLLEYRPAWGGIQDERPYWVSDPSSMLASTASLKLANVRINFEGQIEVVQPEFPKNGNTEVPALEHDYILDMNIDRTKWFDLDAVSFEYHPFKAPELSDEKCSYMYDEKTNYVSICRAASVKKYVGCTILIPADRLDAYSYALQSTFIGGISNGFVRHALSTQYPDFSRNMCDIVSGTVDYIGVPDRLAGDLIKVKALNDDGTSAEHRLYITDVSYEFDGGLTSTITCNLDSPYDRIYFESDVDEISNLGDEPEFDLPVDSEFEELPEGNG